MLKKKVSSIITTAFRLCSKCGHRCTLSATSDTICEGCGEIVEKKAEDSNE